MSVEFKDGRIPTGFNERSHRWHAEELQKFAFPVAECILGDLLNAKDFHIFQLVSRMTEIMFHFRDGWNKYIVELSDKLTKRHLILVEEWRGPTECLISVHNLIHFVEDIVRFSIPDNTWCYVFERCVKRYIQSSTNFKNIECTFANMELRRELVKSLNMRQKVKVLKDLDMEQVSETQYRVSEKD